MFRILGIDPGSRIAGYACIEVPCVPVLQLSQCKVIDAGVLKGNIKLDFSSRIGGLHQALHGLVLEFNPDIGVFEDAFCHKNFRSALKLAQARGSMMASFARENISVAEVAATEVKKSVTGSGHATKEQVSLTLESCLGFQRKERPYDVTDALAIAITYAIMLPKRGSHGIQRAQNHSRQFLHHPL